MQDIVPPSWKNKRGIIALLVLNHQRKSSCGSPGLLVDFAKSRGIDIIIRAIRTIFDFEHETLQAQVNRYLGEVETFYLVVDAKSRLISSTLAREIASHGRRLTDFIPREIEEAVFHRLFQAKGN
ncbi:MAG: hypothetical protein JSR80_04530 [Verrucomicrobia bacterium]|nr:hypothetical protein [Verrucomicrobiota bacterium]